MKNEKFVTVLTVTFAYEAAVAKSRLESEGIFCFLKDELMAQILPFHSNAIGGIKLQVRESDLDRAIEILKDPGYIGEEELPSSLENKESDDLQILMKKGDKICPFCGSEEVFRVKRAGWFFALTSLLFWAISQVPTPFFHKKYYCFDCKQEFKYKRK